MSEKDILQSSLLKFENSIKPAKNDQVNNEPIKDVKPETSTPVQFNYSLFKRTNQSKLFGQINPAQLNTQPDSPVPELATLKDNDPVIPASSPVKICVVGVGGAGNNVINEIMGCQKDLDGAVNCYALNTDLQHFATLKNLSPHQFVLIKSAKTKGKGSGGDPAVGEGATKDFEAGICDLLHGSDLCIIIAGLGKGTGTGGGPIVAQIAKKMGCATIGILITPSHDDGDEQFKKTRASVQNFMSVCDAISIVSNDTVVNKDNISVFEARSMINRTISATIGSIVDTIITPSCQNIDFADLKSFIKRDENVNQLLHLQVDLFDNDSEKIKSKLQNCLEHNLYSTTIDKMNKLLIQFNIGKNCDSSVVRNLISEIKKLTKNDELSITTGIRQVDRSEQKRIEIFLVKPNLATNNATIFNQVNEWDNDFSNNITLSTNNDDGLANANHFATGPKHTTNRLIGATNNEDDFDTDKMAEMINTMLVKKTKKPNIFDEELLTFKETKYKN